MVLSPWRDRVITGVIGGLLGGLLMAVFAMSTSLLRAHGMWMPVKLIGGVVLGFRAINRAGFDVAPIVSGVVIHMMVSAALGALFGLLSARLPSVTLVLYGVVYALIIWFLALFFILPIVDPLMVNRTNPALFAISHIIYGAVLGWWAGSHI